MGTGSNDKMYILFITNCHNPNKTTKTVVGLGLNNRWEPKSPEQQIQNDMIEQK